MIATKTTTLMVAMAVMGIVPVAAHAQSVDLLELVEQSGTAEQISAPEQEQGAANVDEDTNTPISNDEDRNAPTNVLFATVGFGGTLEAPMTSTVDDADVLTTTVDDADVLANSQTETQEAPVNNIPSQTQTPIQAPTLTVGDLMGLLPAGGG